MTDDGMIDRLWKAYGLLLSRQEAVEYLTVEMIAAFLTGMGEQQMQEFTTYIASKLKDEWPPMWNRSPMAVEEVEDRKRALALAVDKILKRSGERAYQIALRGDIQQRIRGGEGE